MSVRPRVHALLPIALLSVAACGDTTGPNGPLTDFLLDFCTNDTPMYFAVQTDGSTWTRVNETGDGTFAFQASPEVGLAYVTETSVGVRTDIIFATAEELEPLNGVSCIEGSGAKTLNGSVQNVDGAAGEEAWISMARSFDIVFEGATTFSLQDLPSGPLDLVAHRDQLTIDGFRPDRVIVRRALSLVDGATITPVLDFEGGDSQPAIVNTLSMTGPLAGETSTIFSDFRTAGGTRHQFFILENVLGTSETIYHIPSGLTQSGDLHDLELFTQSGTEDAERGARRFYRLPGDQVLSLGPPLNTPLVTFAGSSPYPRLRMQLQAQGDYGTLFRSQYLQETVTGGRDVIVVATAGYVGGTPDVWDVTIPIMSGLDDFPTDAMLENNVDVTWYADALGGAAASTMLGAYTDGAFYRYATRIGGVALSTQDAGTPTAKVAPMRRRPPRAVR